MAEGARPGPYTAAAVAEVLWPILHTAPEPLVSADQRSRLRALLDEAWTRSNLTEDDATAIEELIPSDVGEWQHEFGYLQNALAALATAVRSSSDPSDDEAASWALVQLEEAADYAAQSGSDGYVDAAGTAVGRAVTAAARELVDASDDRQRAVSVARSWAQTLTPYWT
jgi:hypothetical protein